MQCSQGQNAEANMRKIFSSRPRAAVSLDVVRLAGAVPRDVRSMQLVGEKGAKA